MNCVLGTASDHQLSLTCGCRAQYLDGKRISIRRCRPHLRESPLDETSTFTFPTTKGIRSAEVAGAKLAHH